MKRPHVAIILGLSFILYFSSSAVRSQNQNPNSLIIGIAEWRNAGGQWINIQQSTFDHLVEKLQMLHLDDVQVVQVPTILENAEWVDQVTASYGIDVLVWGWYDEVAVRGYVDLANATDEDGMTNSLSAFLKHDGNPTVIRVLNVLSEFDYYQDGVSFCVPRWNP